MLSWPARAKPAEITRDVAPGVARVRPAVFDALTGIAQGPSALQAYRPAAPAPARESGSAEKAAATGLARGGSGGAPQVLEFERHLSPLRGMSRELVARGMPAGLVAELLAETVSEYGDQVLKNDRDARLAFVEQLLLRVPSTPLATAAAPLDGVYLVGGPSGSGKSVLIGHLCLLAAEHGQDDVVLVNTESERIGAAAQMEALGKVFGHRVEHLYTPQALSTFCAKRAPGGLVLVELAGWSPAPTGAAESAPSAWAVPGATTVICVPATAQADDLDALLRWTREHAGTTVTALSKTTQTRNVLPAFGALAQHRQPVGMVVPGPNLAEEVQPRELGDVLRAALGVELPKRKKGRGR